MNLAHSIALLTAFCVSAEAFEYQTVVRHGDWVVTRDEIVSNQHIVLDGSLVLKEGGQLTLRNCHVEITGQKSREHIVDWQGGKLITRETIIGGTDRTGTAIHTVFHLYDGVWDAENTVVEFSYGISFSDKSAGILRGKQLRAGRRPDAVIASGLADILLEDSVFPIALGIYTHEGGRATLNLPSNRPLDVVFDSNNLTPGVKWKLNLIRTMVPRWFVFLRNIGPSNPGCEIVMGEVKDVIISLLGHNLTGEMHLTADLSQPLHVGSLTLKRGGQELNIPMWALYFSGDQTDVRVGGKTHICELMVRGGHVQFVADSPNDLSIGCTTLELSGTARLEMRNVHLGRPLSWSGESNEMGEINATDNSQLSAENVSMRNIIFHTTGHAAVRVRASQIYGRIEKREEGGSIEISVLGTNS